MRTVAGWLLEGCTICRVAPGKPITYQRVSFPGMKNLESDESAVTTIVVDSSTYNCLLGGVSETQEKVKSDIRNYALAFVKNNEVYVPSKIRRDLPRVQLHGVQLKKLKEGLAAVDTTYIEKGEEEFRDNLCSIIAD